MLVTLCSILVVLVSFGTGIVVGYRRALFATNWNQNYYHNFMGTPGPGVMVMGVGSGMPPPFNPHGVVGVVIDVGSSSLFIKDVDGEEQSVFVASATPIREMDNNIPLSAIEAGNQVVIIGQPSDTGQVDARFVRVFTTATAK